MKLTPKILDEIIELAEPARAEMTAESRGFFKARRDEQAARLLRRRSAQAALIDKLNTLSDEEYQDLFAVYFTGRDADFKDVWKEIDVSRQHAPSRHTDSDTTYIADKRDLAASLRDARERLKKAGWQ